MTSIVPRDLPALRCGVRLARACAALLVLCIHFSAIHTAAACTSTDTAHSDWSTLLARRVADGRVDYAGFARDDLAALDRYLATLSETCT